MSSVLVSVRYPLSEQSTRTLAEAVEVAGERELDLVVLHVDLYQNGRDITRRDLKREVEAELGHLPNARYLVVHGFIVEETILKEILNEQPDVVVLGHKQLSRWRETINRLFDDPNIANYLQQQLDCEFVIVPTR